MCLRAAAMAFRSRSPRRPGLFFVPKKWYRFDAARSTLRDGAIKVRPLGGKLAPQLNPMADYYPLVARAAAALDNNTAEARRALYERLRSVLLTEMVNSIPPLAESEITRERLALEQAIRRLEAEQLARWGKEE
jgi:hypothetical protein